jgi:hypothetical protein
VFFRAVLMVFEVYPHLKALPEANIEKFLPKPKVTPLTAWLNKGKKVNKNRNWKFLKIHRSLWEVQIFSHSLLFLLLFRNRQKNNNCNLKLKVQI